VLQILHRHLLRDERAETGELLERALHVLGGHAQLDVRGAVAALRRLVVDRLRVAAERRRDSRCRPRRAREMLDIGHAHLQRGVRVLEAARAAGRRERGLRRVERRGRRRRRASGACPRECRQMLRGRHGTL